MKLSEWVAFVGGRRRAARMLDVTPEAVHYWLTGKSTPNWRTIFKILELSKSRVTIREILAETGKIPGQSSSVKKGAISL